MFDGIPVRLDPDLFVQIWIIERALAVRSHLDTELEQNPPDLRTLTLHLWMCYCTVALKRTLFKRKNGSGTLV
jgi:hypothetical protein